MGMQKASHKCSSRAWVPPKPQLLPRRPGGAGPPGPTCMDMVAQMATATGWCAMAFFSAAMSLEGTSSYPSMVTACLQGGPQGVGG